MRVPELRNEILAQWYAGDADPLLPRRGREGGAAALESHEDAAGEPRQHPVRGSGSRVGIDQHDGRAGEEGGQRGGDRRVTSHRDHQVRAELAEAATGPEGRSEQGVEGADPLGDAPADDRAGVQGQKLESGFGDEPLLQASACSDEADRFARVAECLPQGEGRCHVSPGSAPRDDPPVTHACTSPRGSAPFTAVCSAGAWRRATPNSTPTATQQTISELRP